MQISALVALGLIGAVLGLLLGIADKYLQVYYIYSVADKKVTKVNEMLPNFNCGACGYPGCSGFADGVLSGEIKSLKQCKPMKSAAREKIKEYLETTPGADGSVIKVEA